MSAGWPGMTGPTDHVRVGTRSVGEGTCPDYLAAKAHPALWPATGVRTRRERLDTFPLGILNAALNEIERNGATVAQAIDLAVKEAAREGKHPHPAALTWIRELRKTDGSWEIFTAFCLAGVAITAGPAWWSWIHPTAFEWLVLAGVGTLSLGAQLLMTYALRYVRAAVGGVIAQLTPVASLSLGWAFLGERIPPLALIGATLTLAGVCVGTIVARAAPASDD